MHREPETCAANDAVAQSINGSATKGTFYSTLKALYGKSNDIILGDLRIIVINFNQKDILKSGGTKTTILAFAKFVRSFAENQMSTHAYLSCTRWHIHYNLKCSEHERIVMFIALTSFLSSYRFLI